VDDDQGVLQYVKVYWLVDVLAYSASYRLIRDLQGELQRQLWAVRQVDSAQAVASFPAAHPRLVRPPPSTPSPFWSSPATRTTWSPLPANGYAVTASTIETGLTTAECAGHSGVDSG